MQWISKWKSSVNCFTCDQKVNIHGKSFKILFGTFSQFEVEYTRIKHTPAAIQLDMKHLRWIL